MDASESIDDLPSELTDTDLDQSDMDAASDDPFSASEQPSEVRVGFILLTRRDDVQEIERVCLKGGGMKLSCFARVSTKHRYSERRRRCSGGA